MAEQIARFPERQLTVKAEEEQLLAGRCVTYAGMSEEGDYTAVHAAEAAPRIFGVVQRDSSDPKASPAPAPHDNQLRTTIVRGGSIARVLAEAEVKEGEEVEVGEEGGQVVEGETKPVGRALTGGKAGAIIEVELY